MTQKNPMAEIGYGRPSNAEGQCQRCPALTENRKQVVYASNCFIGSLLVVGEAPGKDEDDLGEGFVGAAGCTLDRLLAKHKITRGDYGRANVCRCLPLNAAGKNRKPHATEIANCLPYLSTLITKMKPKVILAVGGTAAEVFCGKAPLYKLIETREKANDWTASFGACCAHQQLQPVLGYAQYVVPMPHTSPMAWNRKSLSGVAWKEIAARSVEKAAKLMMC